ncbi:hypothetical protein [Emticicia sp. 21SJ11W-3]|uniref:hypothetical protein n=1 Tax=Emticicia sp. 21SJ11W-3 TaxID=2916755 RepID=UPI00209EC827|nr:hypothetical protein [Emticicia sp. 21SJ11W-3]UTA67389.1 hypothetical protein MB380_17575 [Emticicia sp. 21SJ11W-3]
MTLTFDDNLIYGTLVYKRVGQAIKVIGSLENGQVLLYEFDPKAEVTGVFFGTKKGNEITGTWSKPSINKEQIFTLKKTSEIKTQTDPVSVTGTYAYNFGKEGGAGMLSVSQTGRERIVVEMQAYRGAPSYNQATIEKTTLKLAGNQAIYENNEFGKCKLKLLFFEGGAAIIYQDEAFECGFGNGATVTGNYLKTDNKPTKFEKQD